MISASAKANSGSMTSNGIPEGGRDTARGLAARDWMTFDKVNHTSVGYPCPIAYHVNVIVNRRLSQTPDLYRCNANKIACAKKIRISNALTVPRDLGLLRRVTPPTGSSCGF